MLRRFWPLTGLCLLTIGCSKSVSAPTTAATVAAASTESDTEALAAESTPTEKPAVEEVVFEPPFPQRTELFDPPRSGQSTVRRDNDHGESVELKGFINVNGPQVVLAIDGVLSPIPEGGEKYGVQVIAINPPQVVLQRGRNRWTASLD